MKEPQKITYSNPQLETLLENTFKQIFATLVILAQYGLKHVKPNKAYFALQFHDLHIRFQQSIESVRDAIGVDSLCMQALYVIEQEKKKISELTIRLNNLKVELTNYIGMDIVPIPEEPVKAKLPWIVKYGAIAIYFLEALTGMTALTAWGFNGLTSIIGGIAYGIVLAAYVSISSWFVSKFKTVRQKVIVIVCLFLVASVSVLTINFGRIGYLSGLLVEEGLFINYPVWPLGVISIFLLAAAFLLHFRNADKNVSYNAPLTEEQKAAIRHKEINDEITALDAEIEQIKADTENVIFNNGIRLEYAASKEQMIIAEAKKDFALFIKEFLKYYEGSVDLDALDTSYPFEFVCYTPLNNKAA